MTTRTRIYLVRHGEIVGSSVFRYHGQVDVQLTSRGLHQYHLLADRLADKKITACYTSDLTRCVQGARILCARQGLEPVLKKELRELSFGKWEGLTWDELAERYPEEWQARMNDFIGYRVPEGENLRDLQNRLMPEIESIIGRHQGEDVLVVGHGGGNRVMLLSGLGAPLSSMFRIEQDFGCINIIDYYADGNPVIKLLNG